MEQSVQHETIPETQDEEETIQNLSPLKKASSDVEFPVESRNLPNDDDSLENLLEEGPLGAGFDKVYSSLDFDPYELP